jgi:hypothetical protein
VIRLLIVPTLSVFESEPDSHFSIYPNPATDWVSVINTGLTDIEAISVYDMNGKIIISETVPVNFLNVSEMSSGMYIVKIISRSESRLIKLLVK